MKKDRLNKVLNEMNKDNLNQMIVTSAQSIFYLTGKWLRCGERMIALLIKSNGEHALIINKLFPLEENLDINLVWYDDSNNPIEILSRYIDKEDTLGIDKDWPAKFLLGLMEINAARMFVNSSYIVDRLRMVKDDEERELMRIASRKNDKVMLNLWNELKEGKSENYYVNVLRELYKQEEINEFSFSPIIAFSPNGADPHHETGEAKLKKGDSIVIDIGGIYKSYCSDMTRTVFFGKEPTEEHKNIYNIVRNANMNGINTVKEGVKFSEIDNAARSYIESNGLGEFFTHRTGHSIGIETHDFGNVGANNYEEVKEGMIFSIEPGIYLPNNIGVRIEDLVMVTKDGCEVLNSVTKDIVVIE